MRGLILALSLVLGFALWTKLFFEKRSFRILEYVASIVDVVAVRVNYHMLNSSADPPYFV